METIKIKISSLIINAPTYNDLKEYSSHIPSLFDPHGPEYRSNVINTNGYPLSSTHVTLDVGPAGAFEQKVTV